MKRILLCALLCYSIGLSGQDFMMQAWYWDYPKDGCNGYSGANWTSQLQSQAASLGQAGFTYMWLPPLSRASFGACSNGYDPKDLYDIGAYGLGRTGFGTEAEVLSLTNTLSANGVFPVADVVYNHRDGGDPEDNPAVKAYIETHFSVGKNPFPSDRFRCVLPIGGSSPYGAGEYYIKISSKTLSYGFSSEYKVYITTNNLAGSPNQPTISETEPNGGGDCGQPFNDILFNQDMNCNLGDWSGCHTDEFRLVVNNGDFFASGDILTFYLNNLNGYTDHRIYGIFYDPDGPGPLQGSNIDLNDLRYETYTNFNNLPSGQGGTNFECFKPNSSNTSTTTLSGDWDTKLFFYDYDQYQAPVQTLLNNWSQWLWEQVKIRGYRMDAVKHFDPVYVGQMLDHLHTKGITPNMVVGEFFDGSPSSLANWVNQATAATTQSSAIVRVFDFAMRDALKNVTDNGADARLLFNSGLVDDFTAMSGFNVVTFVNNHDFRDFGAPIQNDPILPYAYILTNNRIGLPTVFYPDYFGSTIPNAPTVFLKPKIDQLINIHKQHIFAAFQTYLNDYNTSFQSSYIAGGPNDAVIYQLTGGPSGKDVIVAINFGYGPLRVDHQVDVTTAPVGTQFSDLTGNANFLSPQVVSNSLTNIPNSLYIDIPPRSYAVYVASQLLPAELLDFQAQKRGDQVQIKWSVASEVNFDRYELERSKDGIHFDIIATIVGNAEEGGSYEYLDAPSPATKWYYRLRQIDRDETYEYSNIRSVSFELDNPKDVLVYPNPAQHSIQLRWSPNEEPDYYELLDLNGRVLLKNTISRINQDNSIDLLAIPAGVFLIKFSWKNGDSQTEKLVIQP